jgi:hypothetical protein
MKKIQSRTLYPIAKRALSFVEKNHGQNKTLLVHGAFLKLEKDVNGDDVASFYLSRDLFHFEQVETSLRVYIGELSSDEFPMAVDVVDSSLDMYKSLLGMK